MAGGFDVLVLHRLGDFTGVRQTSLNHARSWQRHGPRNRVLYHDVNSPVTEALRNHEFDLVVLDTTFLTARFVRPIGIFNRVRERYAFLKSLPAVKVALPQDEFDNGELLDEWLEQCEVDLVLAGVRNHWDLIFPRTAQRAEIRQALTGYVEDDDVDRIGVPPTLASRRLDVGYRAFDLPPEFGRHGRLKSVLAERFAEVAAASGLVADISTDRADVILGDHWLGFLAHCRHTIGSEGGSSIWDPRGEVRDRVRAYLEEHREASFEEVSAACFPGLDGKWTFSVPSPRIFEAALTHTAQALVRAPYFGVLHPGVHYLPIEPDWSNLHEVAHEMRDLDGARARAAATYETLIADERFRYRTLVRDVMAFVAQRREPREGLVADEAFRRMAERHAAEMRRGERLVPALRRAAFAMPRPLRRLVPPGVKERILARFGQVD